MIRARLKALIRGLRSRPTSTVTAQDLEKLEILLGLVNDQSQPNLNALTSIVRNITLTNLNIKTMGYDLARQLAEALPVDRATTARHVGLACKASIQSDMESDWVAHWCGQLRTPVVFHRKMWELSYVLQAVFENGHMRPGARGLGFGCGVEPLPSYLASHGGSITVTDLPAGDARALGWAATNQQVTSLDQAYHAALVSREAFERNVSLREVDMNAIPDDLTGYDFCWSVCALEHLGTIQKGLDFVRNTLATLRPGGLSVHTLEFNINPEGPTIDNWATVLFQRKHIEQLAETLRSEGHTVAALDFDMGARPMDRFIDLPPWNHDLPQAMNDWLGHPYHLKLALDGFTCTCFGIVVRKAA